MKKSATFFCSLIFLVLCAESINALKIPNKFVITPGSGIDFAKIDQTGDAFIAAVGTSVQISRVTSVNTPQILLHAQDIGVTAVCETITTSLRIKSIIIKNTAFLVKENGLHVGSFESEVTQLMGRADQDTRSAHIIPNDASTENYYLLQYKRLGIMFTISTSEKKVASITVLAPMASQDNANAYPLSDRIIGMGMSSNELLILR
jgi:hypothetical protein